MLCMYDLGPCTFVYKWEDTVNVMETLNLAILQGFQSCYIAKMLFTKFSKHLE